MSQLSQPSYHQAHLRRAVREDRRSHIHDGGKSAVDKGGARLHQLREHHTAQRFCAGLHDLPCKRSRGSCAPLRGRKVNQRDALLGAEDDLLNRRLIVTQRGDRFGVVDDRWGIVKLLFTAGNK